MVANSVYASVGKCIVTNFVKSSFDGPFSEKSLINVVSLIFMNILIC